ncbi:MAG TPA: hemolysin family protein [Spirochaetota bacterium]|nr:hemolysin family protein [Spirochaetota bacterium]
MDILIIAVLILLNGLFALSETALVSSGKTRLESRSNAGRRGAKIALRLLDKPENFLSAIQIGITLVGIVSGAYGGIQLSDDMAAFLWQFEFIRPYAANISLIIVVSAITYFSIVIGELVPKTFALTNPEKIAEIMAPVIFLLSKITYPVVAFLSISTRLLLKLLFISEQPAPSFTEEELRIMIKMAGREGVISPKESELYQNLFRFFDRKGHQIMTRNSDITWININDSIDKIDKIIKKSSHSKFPVCNGSLDSVLGIITVKDYTDNRDRKNFNLKSILKPVTFIPENMSSLRILEKFKKKQCHFGIVIDEFNTVQGIVTLHDLTENIFGELPDTDTPNEPRIIKRSKNSYLVDGETQLDLLEEIIGDIKISGEVSPYSTVAGFIIHKLGRFPQAGDYISENGFRFEVMDLDGLKIDRVMITKTRKKNQKKRI